MPDKKSPPSGFLHRRIATPLVKVLTLGCSPRHLAWSVAIGLAIGLNPLLGSATVVSLAAASILRLNFVASQIATHIVYPIEVALFFVFMRLGNRLFHTGHLPMHRNVLLSAVRHHPWDTTKMLWTWEWHALIVWGIAAIVLTPILAALLLPAFRRLHLQTALPVLVKG